MFGLFQGMDDVQVRGAATDIFSYLVEYNPSMVREFVMQESQQNDDVSIKQERSPLMLCAAAVVGGGRVGYLMMCLAIPFQNKQDQIHLPPSSVFSVCVAPFGIILLIQHTLCIM